MKANVQAPTLTLVIALLLVFSLDPISASGEDAKTTPTTREADKAFNKATRSLIKIEKRVEEWGTTSISQILLLENNGQFDLGYVQDTKDYVEKARSAYQGAARRSLQQILDFQMSTTGSVDAAAVAAAAATSGASVAAKEVVDAVAVESGGPEITSNLPENPAAKVLSGETFSEAQAIADAPSSVSERNALLTGVSDKITELILSTLTNPDKVPDNQVIWMGLMQVNCNPGWRTRTGFMAEVHVTAEYFRLKTTKDKHGNVVKDKEGKEEKENEWSLDGYYQGDADGVHPSVVTILPLLEAQTLDLRNSERTQAAFMGYFASLLTAPGASKQAEKMLSAVRRLEFDSSTRSPIPVVSSYTNGYTFGFQFRPAFQALGDPANKKQGSKNILHPYSFPALVVLSADRDESMKWSHLTLSVSTRWVPVKSTNATRRAFTFKHNFRAKKQMDMAQAFDKAIKNYKIFRKADGFEDVHFFATAEFERRLRELESIGMGQTVTSLLPHVKPKRAPLAKAKSLQIVEVYPRIGWFNAETDLVIKGQGFKKGTSDIVKTVTVGGRESDFTTLGDGLLVVTVPAWTNADAEKVAAELELQILRGNTIMKIIIARKDSVASEITKQELAEEDGKDDAEEEAEWVYREDAQVDFNRLFSRTSPRKPLINLERDSEGRIIGITVNTDGNPSEGGDDSEADKASEDAKIEVSELLKILRTVFKSEDKKVIVDGVEIVLKPEK